MKKYSIHKSNLAFGLIASLLSLNCLSEVTQPASAGQKTITYKSSLSEFKSINNDKDKLSANDVAQDMKGMDHSKMGADEMKDMKAEQKKSVKPAKVKKLKSMKKTAKPMPPDEVLPTAPANPHQDHQM